MLLLRHWRQMTVAEGVAGAWLPGDLKRGLSNGSDDATGPERKVADEDAGYRIVHLAFAIARPASATASGTGLRQVDYLRAAFWDLPGLGDRMRLRVRPALFPGYCSVTRYRREHAGSIRYWRKPGAARPMFCRPL